MTELLRFFENMPTWQKAGWILVCLSASWALEDAKPLVRLGYDKWRHARTNFVLLFTTLAINTAFTVASVGVFAWISANQVGLLYLLELPVRLVVAFLLLDLVGQYLVHFLLHKVGWMWKFHMVHHSDVNVDATTGTRHHPGDYVMREAFALVDRRRGRAFCFLCCIGSRRCFSLTANIAVPDWLDRPLSFVFVTPNLHKFHHHFELPWTDTNYGNILSIGGTLADVCATV